MEHTSLLQADYLDIVFHNRNKYYGGYELRKNYHVRMKKAVTSMLLFCAALVSYSFINLEKPDPNALKTNPAKEITTVICDIKPPVHIEQPKPIATAAPAVKRTVANPPPVIVPDIKVTIPPPTIDELKDGESGLLNAKGDPNGIVVATTTTTGKGTEIITAPTALPPTKPYEFVQEMPSFNGNMFGYLQSNLNYPAAAKENGIEGSVVIQFVVNEDGDISDVKVMRGLGGGCSEEAVRVVKSMPRWKPGRQNGQAVKVFFTLPIRFKLD